LLIGKLRVLLFFVVFFVLSSEEFGRGHLLKKEEISAIFLGYIVKFKLPSHTHTDIIVRQLIVEDSQEF